MARDSTRIKMIGGITKIQLDICAAWDNRDNYLDTYKDNIVKILIFGKDLCPPHILKIEYGLWMFFFGNDRVDRFLKGGNIRIVFI